MHNFLIIQQLINITQSLMFIQISCYYFCGYSHAESVYECVLIASKCYLGGRPGKLFYFFNTRAARVDADKLSCKHRTNIQENILFQHRNEPILLITILVSGSVFLQKDGNYFKYFTTSSSVIYIKILLFLQQ